MQINIRLVFLQMLDDNTNTQILYFSTFRPQYVFERPNSDCQQSAPDKLYFRMFAYDWEFQSDQLQLNRKNFVFFFFCFCWFSLSVLNQSQPSCAASSVLLFTDRGNRGHRFLHVSFSSVFIWCRITIINIVGSLPRSPSTKHPKQIWTDGRGDGCVGFAGFALVFCRFSRITSAVHTVRETRETKIVSSGDDSGYSARSIYIDLEETFRLLHKSNYCAISHFTRLFPTSET